MRNAFSNETKLLGLIGHPIKHSFSPFIYNITSELLNLDLIYLPFDIPPTDLKTAIRGMVTLGFKGWNVTIPHKELIKKHLSNISEEAALVGAVNTVINDVGNLVGYNTDVYGIHEVLMPFKDEIGGLEVTVIGAGGASRAAIYALIKYFRPSKINIINRTEQRADSLKEHFYTKMRYPDIKTYILFPPEVHDVVSNSKLIINTTSVGMSPDAEGQLFYDPKVFHRGQIVFDLVYNPVETGLLRMAKGEGAVTLNGLSMLVSQASKSFKLWTGQEMPVQPIQDALMNYIK